MTPHKPGRDTERRREGERRSLARRAKGERIRCHLAVMNGGAMRAIRRLRAVRLVSGLTVLGLLSACSAAPAASSAASPAANSIVGRWEQTHTCDQLVSALNKLGLGKLAPGEVGDYFPDQTAEQLAAKPDICSGAVPQPHSHFFTADGLFGSLDQGQNQVDDGTYEIVDSNTFTMGSPTFDYSIDGDELTLTPVITDDQRQAALRQPWDFSEAGWMVSVTYPGTTWNRVACQDWC